MTQDLDQSPGAFVRELAGPLAATGSFPFPAASAAAPRLDLLGAIEQGGEKAWSTEQWWAVRVEEEEEQRK